MEYERAFSSDKDRLFVIVFESFLKAWNMARMKTGLS